MIRSAVASLSVKLGRHSLSNSSLAGTTAVSSSNELFRHNDFSSRSFYSSKPTKLIFIRRQLPIDPSSRIVLFGTNAVDAEEELPNGENDVVSEELKTDPDKILKGPPKNAEIDRSKVIPVETSMKYLKSDAYQQTYGDVPVWVPYRRNFKGQFAPKRTRRTCIRSEELTTGNPCPICRDEFLVLDYRNIDLLKQFISPFNGEILSYSKTGLCQKRHMELLVAIVKAKDYGTISFDVPVREYDYSEYEHLYQSYRET